MLVAKISIVIGKRAARTSSVRIPRVRQALDAMASNMTPQNNT